MRGYGRIVIAALAVAVTAQAGKIKQREPGPKARGQVYEWKSKDGLVYRYRVPKGYDADKGANLTFILHGSNLSRKWGFANHAHKTFRPDDLVVSPDGTTSNNRGGFNFLNREQDVRRLHALQEELEQTFKVNAVFLYGHSQGSFFAFLYAGEYPDDVQGVVGHASGVWTNTRQTEQGRHQAIVLMHGTQDPVVPYGQSVGGYKSYVEAKYPILRLRSLEGWNHWPAELNGPIPHTSQQLAWCEGMTTEDPARLKLCFEFLAECKKRERTDYAAVHSLAKRITETAFAPEGLKKRAAAAMKAVNELAALHVRSLASVDLGTFDGKAWIGHVPMFLRTFGGVPAREEFAKKWAEVLQRHERDGLAHLRAYWRGLKEGDTGEAFAEGVAAIKNGYLDFRCADREFLKKLESWSKEARKLGLPREAVKDYRAIVPDYRKALKDGSRAFDSLNRKCKKL